MGAEVNAGTGKETTVRLLALPRRPPRARVRRAPGHGPAAAYPDIESERQVVIEEIAMYEDEPQDKVHDVLADGDLRRAPARPPDHRPRRGVVGARAERSRLARRALRAAADRRGGGGQLDHERLVELVEARLRRARGAGAGRADCRPTAPAPAALPPQGHRAVPPLPGRRRDPAQRRPPLRARACSTRSSAAPPPRASSRRCARSAGSPTRSTRTRATTRPGQVASTWAPGRTTSPRRSR